MQHAAKQQRCINRRQFATEQPLSTIDIDEVVEETVLVRTFFEQKGQGLLHSLFAIQRAKIVVFGGDAQSAQAEAGGGDAGDPAEGSSDGPRPVPYEAAPGTGLVKEEVAVPSLHVVEEGVGHPRDLGERAVDEHAWRVGVLFGCLALGFWGGRGGV